MCHITFSTSDRDILSPAMANIKWLENTLQAQVHLSFCACFDQIFSWKPGLWITVSQLEDTLKCYTNVQHAWRNSSQPLIVMQLFMRSEAELFGLHLASSSWESRFPCLSVIPFLGISDGTQTCWQAAVTYLLYRGAVSLQTDLWDVC